MVNSEEGPEDLVTSAYNHLKRFVVTVMDSSLLLSRLLLSSQIVGDMNRKRKRKGKRINEDENYTFYISS